MVRSSSLHRDCVSLQTANPACSLRLLSVPRVAWCRPQYLWDTLLDFSFALRRTDIWYLHGFFSPRSHSLCADNLRPVSAGLSQTAVEFPLADFALAAVYEASACYDVGVSRGKLTAVWATRTAAPSASVARSQDANVDLSPISRDTDRHEHDINQPTTRTDHLSQQQCHQSSSKRVARNIRARSSS
jgi:hypothetical protein